MTYLEKGQMDTRRAVAIVGVVAIHAMMGYALVTGLAYKVIRDVVDNPDGVFVPLPEPTKVPEPEPQPQPSPDTAYQDPVAPTPPLNLPRPAPFDPAEFDPADVRPDVIEIPQPRVTPSPPLPSPRPTLITPKSAVPKNGPQGWITTEDYPSRPLRQGAEGTARYRVVVGTDGRVNACEITTSAGNGGLDEATCKLISRRARFQPATNDQGAQVVGTYSGSVTWQIPK